MPNRRLPQNYLRIVRRVLKYALQAFVVLSVALFLLDLTFARGTTRPQTGGGFHVGTDSGDPIQDAVVFLARPTVRLFPQANRTFSGSFLTGFGLLGEGGAREDEIREWLATAHVGTFYISTPANTVGSGGSKVQSVFPRPSGSRVVEVFTDTRPPELVEDNSLGVLGQYQMPGDAVWHVLTDEGIILQSMYVFSYHLETGPMWTKELGIGKWKFDINIKPHSAPTFVGDLGSAQTVDRTIDTYLDGPQLEILLSTEGTGMTLTELTPSPDVENSTMARWYIPLGASMSIRGIAEAGLPSWGGIGRLIVDRFWPIIVIFAVGAGLNFAFSRFRRDKESVWRIRK